MATLVLGAVGSTLGGPLGGAVGALAGRQVDGLLLGPGSRGGTRLRELEVSLSSYGSPIPQIHGRMRVPGAIIWATELQEHSERRGGGKGQPGLTTHTYSANMAVALSSRPVRRLGRIWADGKLLRGAEGDLKVEGSLRFYGGTHDQLPDPLIAASTREGHCPAFRGIAYVVFESLALAEFGNRIPALTFEVVADDEVRISDIMFERAGQMPVYGDLTALSGLIIDGSLGETLAALHPILPISIDGAAALSLQPENDNGQAVVLEEPALAVDDDAFGRAHGFSRRRESLERQPPQALRYLDISRDYLPGTQYASGRTGPGQPRVLELPAALSPSAARALVEQRARRQERARERILWRTSSMNTALAPGSTVQLPGQAGTWHIASWEWREAGVELELTRSDFVASPDLSPVEPSFQAPVDLPSAETRLVALELPWNGAASQGDASRLVAAVGATAPTWRGAALYVAASDGQLWPLGSSGRERAVIGMVGEPLSSASPLLLDRTSRVTVDLTSSDQSLSCASFVEMSSGANLALVGDEIVQFARADPLGPGVWQLSWLIRGCGGTETAIHGHSANEPFVLLDEGLTLIESPRLEAAEAHVAAIGHGDLQPVTAAVRLRGIGKRPLAPVHGRADWSADGALEMRWTRRARGGWDWTDRIDMPLGEEAERYLVTFECAGTPRRGWSVTEPLLRLSPDELAALSALAPAGTFLVRQQGTHALSPSLLLYSLH